MSIERINMAVPVGRGTPWSRDDVAAAEVASEAAELDALTQNLLQALRRRQKFTWSQRSRALMQNQFDMEMKGLVKRLVSSMTSAVADRQGRADIRVRMYSDVMTIVKAACQDVTLRTARRRTLQRWLWSTVGCVVTLLLLMNAVLVYPHMAVG